MSYANVSRYQQNQIYASSREEILISLFDGAIRFTREAREAMVQKQYAKKGEGISRVIAILSELQATLDTEKAPELCNSLAQLYSYLIMRLEHASLKLDLEPMDEVIQHLTQLRGTWSEAIQNNINSR